MSSELFAGTPKRFGGLSNERELVNETPDEFRTYDNKWTRLASSIFFNGADIRGWSFRSQDPGEIKHQKQCLRAVLMGCAIKHEHKESLAGWMLSEMLTELPS